MPTVQELPHSKTFTTPGWAYVPDTAYPDPSKAPLAPTARKRAARSTTTLTGPNTPSTDTRLAATIQKHINELDKESSRDVQINLSGKGGVGVGGQGPGAGRKGEKGSGDKKMTPNVRRILTSNKTFANHLADEEAMLAGLEGGGSTSRPRAAATAGMRRTSTMALSSSPPPQARRASSSTAVAASSPPPPPPTSARQTLTSSASTSTTPVTAKAVQSDPEDDPLLRTYIPAPPSAAEMEALVNAPPLSYNQAKAAPSVGRPQRYFCEICGYWGSVRCLKCGARVCGLECKGTHDEGRCLRF